MKDDTMLCPGAYTVEGTCTIHLCMLFNGHDGPHRCESCGVSWDKDGLLVN